MKLRYFKRSAVISVSCNESQVSEAKHAETCWTNYPTCEAKWGYNNVHNLNNLKVTVGSSATEACRLNNPAKRRVVRLKLQKRSE